MDHLHNEENKTLRSIIEHSITHLHVPHLMYVVFCMLYSVMLLGPHVCIHKCCERSGGNVYMSVVSVVSIVSVMVVCMYLYVVYIYTIYNNNNRRKEKIL